MCTRYIWYIFIRTPEKEDIRRAKRKGPERKKETKTNMHALRVRVRPSLEGTRLLFAGTISPMICL